MVAPRIIVPPKANLAVYGRVGKMDQAKIDEWAKGTEAFFGFQAFPYYNLTVKGFLLQEPQADANDKFSKKQIARVNHGSFVPDYHMVIGGYNNERCGEAESPGKYGNVYNENPTANCKLRTVSHEHVHQLGIQHSGRIDAVTGELRQYGDTTCLMGTSAAWYGLSAPKIHQLGWYEGSEVFNVTGSGKLRLAPLELKWSDLRDEVYRFAYIPAENAYISLRKARVNYPYKLDRLPNVAYVHWHEKSTGFDYRYNPDLEPGKVLQLKKGTIIEYIEYFDDNEEASFNIIVPGSV